MKYILQYTGGKSNTPFYLKEFKERASFGYFPKFLWTSNTSDAMQFLSPSDAEGFALKHRMMCSVISIDDDKDNYDYAMGAVI